MDDFNKNLISKVKQLSNDKGDFEYSEDKYSFLLYAFEQIEEIEKENLDIFPEEFPFIDVNIDGSYYDEDANCFNLFLVIYNDENNDNSKLSNSEYLKEYKKIYNLIKIISDKTYATNLEASTLTYDICDSIARKINESEVTISIFSNYKIDDSVKINGKELIGNINVMVSTYDLDDLKRKFYELSKESNILDLQTKFGTTVPAVKISSTIDFDVYMCSFKGTWLAQLYKEDGQRLLEPNVRSYLKRTQKTNAGIIETVKNCPEQFVSYNNGLSSIASSAEIISNTSNPNFCTITKLDNFQIVNGGQTTATLAECLKDKCFQELNEIVVPVKLTIIKNIVNASMLINNISVFSNTQTAIKKSDPPSNLQYYIDLKSLSNNVTLTNKDGKNYICYFERTAGEYDTELKRNNSTVAFKTMHPKDKKFNKLDLANSINCWQEIPYIVNQGREKNFQYFNNIVKNQILQMDQTYFKKAYATIILKRSIDKICKNLKLSYKINVATYTLSYLAYISKRQIDLIKIFNNQKIDDNLVEIIKDVAPKIHKEIMNVPANCPEQRMWARKEELWKRVKLIFNTYNFVNLSEETNFFPINKPQLFIDNDENFYSESNWRLLLIWNDSNHVLNKSQTGIINAVLKAIRISGSLTKKQINFAKDVFMTAVKNGFKYN